MMSKWHASRAPAPANRLRGLLLPAPGACWAVPKAQESERQLSHDVGALIARRVKHLAESDVRISGIAHDAVGLCRDVKESDFARHYGPGEIAGITGDAGGTGSAAKCNHSHQPDEGSCWPQSVSVLGR